MSTRIYKTPATEMLSRMSPATLVSFIRDMDNGFARDMDNGFARSSLDEALLTAATEALFGNAGAADAIAMLGDAEINASDPIIAAVVEEWAVHE